MEIGQICYTIYLRLESLLLLLDLLLKQALLTPPTVSALLVLNRQLGYPGFQLVSQLLLGISQHSNLSDAEAIRREKSRPNPPTSLSFSVRRDSSTAT